MMKRSLIPAAFLAGLSLLGLGCPESNVGPAAPKTSSTRFNRLLDGFILGAPSDCRWLGLHDSCDGRVADYSEAGIKKRIAILELTEKELRSIDRAALDEDAKLDHDLLDLAVRQELFRLVDLELWRRRPQFYEELFAIDGYLVRDYAPLDVRAKALLRHVNAALPQIAHILENLEGPMPLAFVKTDIGIFQGHAEYLRGDVVKILGGVTDPKLASAAIGAVRRLAEQAEILASHLEKVELPRADDSHVLGVDRYKKLLAVQEALDVDLDAFMKTAEADLDRNKRAYEALAAKGITGKRPKSSELLGAAKKVTFEARDFIREKRIVSIPEEGNLDIVETPPFMRWNSAFLNGPGPFDKPELVAFYYITLPDPSWSPKEQEEYVMTYGNLLSTSVHEVFPGHFLQGLWGRRAPTRAQRMLGSYSFIEGWAHYTEQLMIEEGFGASDPESAMGQLNDALLRNCRFVVSIGMHTKGMTLDQAEERFVKDCKQDQKTAKQQAFRGTFDPGYFAYTLGKIQILELREEAKKRLGSAFDLQKFHDALLSHGSPPVPTIKARVLAEIGAK